MRLALCTAAAALAIITVASANARPAAPAAASADALVAARQASFRLNLSAFLGTKAALARGDDVKTLVLPASAMAAWGRAMPGLFPAGATNAASKALPTVWSDAAGFTASAQALATAADKLAAAAKAGDAAAANAAFAEVGAACQSCHQKYRAEDKH